MPELQNTSGQSAQSSGAQGQQQPQSGGNLGNTGTQGTQQGAQGAGGALNNPGSGGTTPVQLSEDSMVILPGSKDPVRYGDHYRGFQSEFTKRSQNLTAAQRRIKELESHIQQAQRGQGQQQGQQQQGPDPFVQLATELNGLQYLNGPQAAAVVGHVMQRFQSVTKELRKRDLALGMMYKRLQAIQQHLGGVVQRHQGADFESKMAKFTKDANLPDEAREFVSELYTAYEGDDLDEQFPAILKKRLEQLSAITRKSEQRRIDEARGVIPGVTTQGGNGSASRRLSNNFGKKSAAQIADELWNGMDGNGQNT